MTCVKFSHSPEMNHLQYMTFLKLAYLETLIDRVKSMDPLFFEILKLKKS